MAKKGLEDLTALAAQMCETPIAFISLVDEEREYFRARTGPALDHAPGADSFCAHANLQAGIFVVPDACSDPRFAANPLVTGELRLRFFAGAPLISADGRPLGTLCVVDHRPRQLNPMQEAALAGLRRQATTLLELGRELPGSAASAYPQGERGRVDSNRLAAIVDSSEDGIIGKDLSGIISSWNKGAENIFGCTEAEMLGSPILRLIPADRQHEENSILEQVRRGEKIEHYETVRLRKDGRLIEVSVSISPIRDESGRIIGAAKVVRDISKRKQAEATNRESNRVLVQTAQRLRQALVTARMVWWEWNIKTGSIHIDPCGARCILGYGIDQLAGMTFDTWLDWMLEEDRDEVRRTLALTLSGANNEWVCEYRWRGPTGEYQWLRDIGRISLRSAEGKPLLMTGSTQDISQVRLESDRIKQLEYQLMQSQKMETLGQFSSGIAHDFNNLLTGISGGIHLALEGLPPRHALAASLQNAQQGCTKGRDLVKRLLQIARDRVAAQPKEIQLDGLVRDIIPLIRASMPENVSLELDLDSCPPLLADETQMLQMILNLAVNGAHAIGPLPGKIGLSLKREPAGADTPAAALVLCVSDTGCGMDEQTQARIFEPFYTTKPLGGGTGLGLAVVLGVVKEHGGTIECRSALGQGTTFKVVLPVIASAATVQAEGKAPGGATAGPVTRRMVLVVDDEPVIATLLTEALRRTGYDIAAFTSPREALEKLRENPLGFDLLVTDLTMPEISGVDLIRVARELCPSLPVVLISGDFGRLPPGETLAEFEQLVMVNKPLDLPEFRRSVQELVLGTLNQRGSTPPQRR